MKLPNIKILDEKNKILHQKSKDVTFPVSKEDRRLAEDTIKYLEMSQNEKIAEKYDLPANWKMRAQIPFGSIEAPAGEKEFMADQERFKVFGD